MYIPYNKISDFIKRYISNNFLYKYFYNKKISQNVKHIENNQKKVIIKLQNKFKKQEKINVAFYLYDETKWKCQSLYDLLKKDNRFNPKILFTKNSAKDLNNPSYQEPKDIIKDYELLKSKGLNVELAYDFKKNKHIPFECFKPDIIIYQHPWYVETSQGPVVCSNFALTYYIPYYFPTTTAAIDYHLRFHQYIEKYCVFDEITKETYKKKMPNKAKNVIVTGQPFLDYYKTNQNKDSKYIIYAPHWTICNQGISYGTFEWNGKFMLEYAKQHKNQKWIFKPHPLLKKTLVDKKVMTENEANEYYNSWDEIGLKYEKGEYLDLFLQSKMLITDCSSFLGEYFFTGKPVIHLISQNATPYNETINQIIKYYYKAQNLENLKSLLDNIEQNDWMEKERKEALNKLNAAQKNAAENILSDILNQLEAK